ncbi:MAG: EpsG family protein [Lachnospiraceae bacterium]|nr:EpsG family protein [Lachnospiraceae bacterium]
MLIYILLTIVTVGFAAFVNNGTGKSKYTEDRTRFVNVVAVAAIFGLLFLVSALRVGIGNDYYRYVEFINRITFDSYVPTEPGFNLLVKLCNIVFGNENAIAVFAVIAFLTLGIFLKAIYDQSISFGWTFFLFMTLGYYFQTLNTVRYYLALTLVLYSMRYVMKKQYGRFVVMVLIASLFHKSALLVIPVYILAALPWKKWMVIAGSAFIAVFGISAYFFNDFYMQLLVRLYPSYEGTGLLVGGTSVVNILRCAGVLFLAVICMQKKEQWELEERFYFYLNYGALLLYVFCSFIPQISRICYYLTISQILYIPLLLQKIAENKKKMIWKILVAVAACLYFLLFLYRARADEIGIVPYHSWLFTEKLDYKGTWE